MGANKAGLFLPQVNMLYKRDLRHAFRQVAVDPRDRETLHVRSLQLSFLSTPPPPICQASDKPKFNRQLSAKR